MKALLIHPTMNHAVESEASPFPREASGAYPPLGLLYLQASAEKTGRHRVDIVDDGLPGGLDDCIAKSADQPPDLVGISVMTPNLRSVVRTIGKIKTAFPKTILLLGGPHCDIFPVESAGLDQVDFVMTGECEETFPAMLDRLENRQPVDGIPGLARTSGMEFARPWIQALDDLPIPDRSRIGIDNYKGLAGTDETFATLISSRGCPYRCTFCSTPHGQYRFRSIERILDEVDRCASLGIGHVYFLDDCFPSKGERLAEFCKGMMARRGKPAWSCRAAVAGLNEESLRAMKLAGCTRVQIGVETNTDEGLQILGKAATVSRVRETFRDSGRAGIQTMAYFMLGLPHERRPEDIVDMVRFAIRLKPTFAMFNVLTLYPGTALFDRAAEKGIVEPNLWRRFAERPEMDFEPPFWTEHMDRRQLLALQNGAYRKFYWRPSVLIKQLFAGGGLPGVWKRLKVGLGMLFSGGKS